MTGSLLVTGALTVVAAALQADQPVDRVVWMGGAVAGGGNMTAAAEFNAWLDPEACDRVLASGVPLAMVPLDITHQVSFDPAELGVMAGLGAVAGLSAQACAHFHATGAPAYPHDAVAAVAWLHPELFEWEERWVRCELAGTWTRGMTVVDRRPHGVGGAVRIPAGVDVPSREGADLRGAPRARVTRTHGSPGSFRPHHLRQTLACPRSSSGRCFSPATGKPNGIWPADGRDSSTRHSRPQGSKGWSGWRTGCAHSRSTESSRARSGDPWLPRRYTPKRSD